MNGLKKVFTLIICINVSTVIAQYIDDSDYDDYQIYEELLSHKPVHKQQSIKQEDSFLFRDDFYIINDDSDGTDSGNDVYSVNDDEMGIILSNDDRSMEMMKPPPYEQMKWFQAPERVYQYTKRRIPGYDYDELDFTGVRRLDKCDARSVWSHCVCQFTCSNPNEVDCFMPCISGCECKEDFVFDQHSQRCITPEKCPGQQDFNVYKK